MKWEGNERRFNEAKDDHDSLIALTVKMETLDIATKQHIEKDDHKHEKLDNKFLMHDRLFWMFAGAVILIELLFKLFK